MFQLQSLKHVSDIQASLIAIKSVDKLFKTIQALYNKNRPTSEIFVFTKCDNFNPHDCIHTWRLLRYNQKILTIRLDIQTDCWENCIQWNSVFINIYSYHPYYPGKSVSYISK